MVIRDVRADVFPCSAATHPRNAPPPAVEIIMWGYAEGDVALCRSCALQLARKLLEDLCELAGDRHG